MMMSYRYFRRENLTVSHMCITVAVNRADEAVSRYLVSGGMQMLPLVSGDQTTHPMREKCGNFNTTRWRSVAKPRAKILWYFCPFFMFS